jgi:hypothetical protein
MKGCAAFSCVKANLDAYLTAAIERLIESELDRSLTYLTVPLMVAVSAIYLMNVI